MAEVTVQNQVAVFRKMLEDRSGEYAAALPTTIRPIKFQRVALTAVTQNPQLLTCSKSSLMLSLMKCAQDGLVPDGKEAALVVFNSKRGPQAQYLSMVAGVRKLVHQSGRISTFDQALVYENDDFDFELGTNAYVKHKRKMSDRGKLIGAYSVATTMDGKKSFEVMSIDEIEKRRNVSRAKDKGPWVDWYEEMVLKTIAKHHAKSLPISSTPILKHEDELELTLRDDGSYGEADTKRLTRAEALERLASGEEDDDQTLEQTDDYDQRPEEDRH